MIPSMQIELHSPALLCAHGSNWQQIWATFSQLAKPAPAPWPATGRAALDFAWSAPEPAISQLGVDRKLARTMEKQAKLALAAASSSLAGGLHQAAQQIGLYLGLPTVDEAVPGWAALQDWHASGCDTSLSDVLLRGTPPFSGLTLLNSSVAAHISASNDLRGSMAIHSPHADASLNALIDGVLAVAEGECPHALIGATSPKLDPLLPVQQQVDDDESLLLPPGEAGVALMASPGTSSGVHLAGYARGLLPVDNSSTALQTLVDRALAMAGLGSSAQVGWLLHNQPWTLPQQQALADLTCPPLCLNIEQRFGRCGPAASLLACGLALYGLGLRQGWHNDGELPQSLAHNNALIIALAPLGQCVVVVLAGEQP